MDASTPKPGPNSDQHLGERRVRVELGERSYDVVIGSGVLGQVGAMASAKLKARCRKAFIVVDEALPKAALASVESSLRKQGIETFSAGCMATEHEKSLDSLDKLLTEITRRKLERRDVVVALGGGIIGDLAGFAASVYRRGIPIVQCPTTLLSMVDASVGGKTGVNIDLSGDGKDLKKNMIGAFHQPIGVLADVTVLASLDERHYRAGMAECIKHGMIGADFEEPTLLDWTFRNAASIAKREPAVLTELIARNVAIKARVVAGDEREETESGGRALLNLGHTFGHAIEALPKAHGILVDGTMLAGAIHHGEAVALGLRAACEAAVSLGNASKTYAEQVGKLLDVFRLPQKADGLPTTDQIVERMSHDKKNVGGAIRLILPDGEARATVVENPPIAAIRGAIDSIRA